MPKLAPSRPRTYRARSACSRTADSLLVEGGGRLDLVTVDGNQARIDAVEEGFNGPVSVALAGDTAWVAEGQLDILFDSALKDKKPELPFRIVGVPIVGR